MNTQVNGRALVRSEFESILYDLNEAQAINDRRRFGEPVNEEMTVRVMTANEKLSRIAKILIAGALLALAVFLVIRTANCAMNRSDAKTPILEYRQ